jgi:hypothetical protein
LLFGKVLLRKIISVDFYRHITLHPIVQNLSFCDIPVYCSRCCMTYIYKLVFARLDKAFLSGND